MSEAPHIGWKKLKAKVAFRFVLFFLILATVLFGTGGTFRYWQAWIFILALGAAITTVSIYFSKRDPQLLERRMRIKEKEPLQKLFLTFSIPLAILVYVLPGLDKRFGWTDVPPVLSISSVIAVLVAYYLFVRVLQENSYASRIIEVEAGQRVVKTGPYAVVRHPMYVAAMFIHLCSPLALGSYVAFTVSLLFIPPFIMRILNEEDVLERELEGYREYLQQVKYRLVPGIW